MRRALMAVPVSASSPIGHGNKPYIKEVKYGKTINNLAGKDFKFSL